MKEENCITLCINCGNSFEYSRTSKKPRKVCDDCRKAVMTETLRRYKKKFRSGRREAVAASKHDLESGLLKSSHAEIAAVLNLNESTVRETEQSALIKIRNNPQLKNLFDIWKEDGTPLSEGAFGYPKTDSGKLLLEYLLQLVDWWAIHDKIAETGQTPEALECLNEIETFRKKLIESIEKI